MSSSPEIKLYRYLEKYHYVKSLLNRTLPIGEVVYCYVCPFETKKLSDDFNELKECFENGWLVEDELPINEIRTGNYIMVILTKEGINVYEKTKKALQTIKVKL